MRARIFISFFSQVVVLVAVSLLMPYGPVGLFWALDFCGRITTAVTRTLKQLLFFFLFLFLPLSFGTTVRASLLACLKALCILFFFFQCVMGTLDKKMLGRMLFMLISLLPSLKLRLERGMTQRDHILRRIIGTNRVHVMVMMTMNNPLKQKVHSSSPSSSSSQFLLLLTHSILPNPRPTTNQSPGT